MKRRNFLYLTGSLTLTVGTKAVVTNKATAASEKVVMGQIGLSFYAVVGGVIQSVLERLGHTVEVKDGTHADIFPLLGRGEVDLLVAAWLPGAHGPFWEKYGDRAIQLGTLYTDARLYWAVADYVPNTVVSSVEDLTKPEVVAKMSKTIQGINPSSGLMRGSSRIMEEYGLKEAGYSLVPGTPKQWIENFETAVAQKNWVIMPLWQPQFLNQAYQVRALEEPKGLLGGADRAILLGYQDFERKFPSQTVATLKRIDIGLDAVTQMDYMVNVKGMTAQEAARFWMRQNSGKVNSWFKNS